MTTQYVVALGYLIVLFLIGYLGWKLTKNQDDFYIAGGKIGWLVGGSSIAATHLSAGTFIGTIGVIYSTGWSFGWTVFAMPVAFWLMVAVIGPRFTRQRKLSLPEFLGDRYYSTSARVIGAVIVLFAFVIFISSQIIAGGLIINALFGVPLQAGMAIFMLVVLLYTAIGGMFAVLYTDFLQMMVMVVGVALAVPLILERTDGMGNLLAIVNSAEPLMFTWDGMAPSLIFTSGIAFMLGVISKPELLVRLWAMKDMKTIRKGTGFIIILLGVNISMLFVLVLGSRALFPALASPDNAVPVLAANALTAFLGSVLLLAVASAMMSSLSSVLLVASTALANDIYGVVRPKASVRSRLTVGRIGTVVVGLVPLVMVFLGFGAGELVQFIVLLFNALMGATFLLPVLAGVLWRRATREGAITSMIGGLACTIGWRLFGDTSLIDPVVSGVVAAFVLMVGVSLVTPKPPRSATEPIFGKAKDSQGTDAAKVQRRRS